MTSLPTLAAIEFPGVLRDQTDPSRALAALGGEQAVNAFISCPAEDDSSSNTYLPASRLTLNLRMGRNTSNSNIVSDPVRPTPNLFLLEVTEHETTPQQASQTHSQLVGRVTALTEFRALADFHYHPRETYRFQDGSRVAILPPTTEPNGLAGHLLDTLTNRPAQHLPLEVLLDRLRPSRFARSAPERGAMNYWYKQYAFPVPPRPRENAPDEPAPEAPESASAVAKAAAEIVGPLALIPGRPLGDDGRSQPDRLDRLPHRVSYASQDVPSVAHIVRPPVHRGRQSYAQLLCLLKKLFKRRPVWVRRALLLGVPPELRTGFKKAISVVSYSFQGSGPFFQACIRYGYDPRTDPQSRKYQVIEVRCGHPLVEAARVIQDEQQMAEDGQEGGGEDTSTAKVHGLDDSDEEDEEDEDEDDNEEQLEIAGRVPLSTFQMPAEFLLDRIPKKRNNFFQICDISLPPIVKAVSQERMGRKYNKKDGHFTEGGIMRLQTVAKSTLFSMSLEVVGEERSKEILRGNYKSIRAMYSRKRGRVQLRDVIKEGARRPPKRAPTTRSTRGKKRTRSDTEADLVSEEPQAAAREEEGDGDDDGVEGQETEGGIMAGSSSGVGDVGANRQAMGVEGIAGAVGQLSYVMEDEDEVPTAGPQDEAEEEEDEEDAEELAAFEVYDSDSDGALADDGLDDEDDEDDDDGEE